MLSFSSTTFQSSLVVKDPARLPPIERIVAGRRPSLIVPRLYLSNLFTARSPQKLAALGVTHVVSVIEVPPELPASLSLKKLHVPLADTSDADILQHLDATTAFIREALTENDKNVVLVHCMMGISRSATVVCAYLVATTTMTASEAISFAMFRRSVVCPNLGFRKQLETYAVQFRGEKKKKKDTVSHVADKLRVWAGGARARQKPIEVVVTDK